MAEITIRLARDDNDIENVKSICWDWYDWHWQVFPADWPKEGTPLDADVYAALVEDLPNLHARPSGGIILALLDETPVGCVMYSPAGDGVAEFFRMFVRKEGRGHGIGRKMLDWMFQQMIADGYRKVVFSSAVFLTHARAMYESAGFSGVPVPDRVRSGWRERVYFMERSLP